MSYVATAVVLTLAGGALAAYHSSPAGRRSAAERYARAVDLDLGALRAVVEQRLARRERAGALGAAAGAWVTVGLLATVALPSSWLAALAPIGFLAGAAVAYAAVAWRDSGGPLRDGPRIARATAPGHDDYVPRHERWGAWVAAGVATALAVGLVVVDAVGALDLGRVPLGLAAVTAALPWVLAALDVAVARRLLDRPQVATSTHELAWDDALRARTLRDLVGVVITVAVVLPVMLLSVVADGLPGGWPDNPAVGVVMGLTAAILGAAGVMALVSLVLDPRRHVRSRLWPVGRPASGQPAGATPGGVR